MGLPQENQRYTYADYLTWEGDERYELIEGVPYLMASPSQYHQEISVELARQLANFLFGKPCKLYTAPFDVRLYPQNENADDTVVQPDLLVVCDSGKLDGRACNGAPTLVIEILSPSTSRKDLVLKMAHYRWAGVKEYWIIDPQKRLLCKHVLVDGSFTAEWFDAPSTVPVAVLPGCEIDLAQVFGEEEPNA